LFKGRRQPAQHFFGICLDADPGHSLDQVHCEKAIKLKRGICNKWLSLIPALKTLNADDYVLVEGCEEKGVEYICFMRKTKQEEIVWRRSTRNIRIVAIGSTRSCLGSTMAWSPHSHELRNEIIEELIS
jgi:hypothetical protein